MHPSSYSYRIEHAGAPDVLQRIPTTISAPGPTEVTLAQEAVGVNYLDVMQRNGSAPLALPNGIGLEAAGRVTAVGSQVRDWAVGDRVGYILGPIGAYASVRNYPAERLVRLPESLSAAQAAAVMFKGVTAHYLLTSTFAVGPGTTVLLYGAAGALGQLMVAWAKHLGAQVIGVVSKDSSADRALAHGCDAALVWGRDDIAASVAQLPQGRKADVVYAGVGKDTFAASIDSLRPRGVMVSIGASSGAPAPVEVSMLNAKGSLFLTRPSIVAHATDLTEYHSRMAAVWAAVADGILPAQPWKTYALEDAVAAHDALERHGSGGPIVLLP